MRKPYLQPAISLTILLGLASLPGCRGDNDPHVLNLYAEFTYETEMDNYTAVDDFDWQTPGGITRVDFEAFNFGGTVRVQVFDDDGDEVYDRTFSGSGHVQDHQDETDTGDSGEWEIVITSTNADGRVYLKLFPLHR